MEALRLLGEGFGVALTGPNLLAAALGSVLGTAVGVLPGLGPPAALALLLPLTYGLNPVTAMVMFAAIYYGAMYGGSTTAILLNVPGEVASVTTTLDGHQMARAGRAGVALGMSAFASFIAGTLSTLGLTFAAKPFADFAVRFGPPEQFALMLLALTLTANLSGRPLKGAVMLTFGMLLSTVGLDSMSGVKRFTFGLIPLLDGFDLIVVLMGVFGVGEVLYSYAQLYRGEAPYVSAPLRLQDLLPGVADWVRARWAILRGTAVGFLVGILPGAGAGVASFVSYGLEKRMSRTPQRFGQGAVEGVASAEASNNAAVAGTLVPMFALGIPGSATAALLMVGLINAGLQPGPLLMQNHPEVVWGVIASMYIGNALLLALNLPLIGLWVRLLRMPYQILAPIILLLTIVGTYADTPILFDLVAMVAFGVLGYLLRIYDWPLVPVVIGLVLGPMVETSLRRSLVISMGSLGIFITRPLSLILVLLTLLVACLPLLPRLGGGSPPKTSLPVAGGT
ncbi:MAG: tripartite tricarboxylate transporter permease [Armatimonadota bacterium]|nr:tripartite tricarboxylate transporter permease [Armatimonadota bacterium]MDR7459962.1 tripartite tricarboxylate transporter permease [Armatimonadota bacterium]MDR7479592.1 tripartite tricarboxylate transporter permease [Armatimonadota bacterium]MDR7490565.1 tripartite tricarboxylate transporter permease [Armatimonadota bacterium]MDR7526545.1 tripartite tricarboxylate transporter permease [Armatimonadota bacterium]